MMGVTGWNLSNNTPIASLNIRDRLMMVGVMVEGI